MTSVMSNSLNELFHLSERRKPPRGTLRSPSRLINYSCSRVSAGLALIRLAPKHQPTTRPTGQLFHMRAWSRLYGTGMRWDSLQLKGTAASEKQSFQSSRGGRAGSTTGHRGTQQLLGFAQ